MIQTPNKLTNVSYKNILPAHILLQFIKNMLKSIGPTLNLRDTLLLDIWHVENQPFILTLS